MIDDLLEDMVDPAPSPQDVARRRRVWATGTILALAAVGVTSLTTSALFTDEDELTRTFSTGTVVLDAGGAELPVPAEGLAPGSTVVAPVTLVNAGSLALRYAVSVSARSTSTPGEGVGEGDLTSQLRVEVLEAPACTAPTGDARTLGDSARLLPAGVTYGLPSEATPLVGDPSTGQDAEDRVLPGGSGATDALCVRLEMSRDADNRYQGTSAELLLRFDSEQTVNN